MKPVKLVVAFVLILSLIAFTFIDVFQELSITKEQAQENIVNSITSGSLWIPDKAKSIAIANRATVVQAIGTFAKSYMQTAQFKSQYADWWKSQEPIKPKTPEEKAAERKKQEEDGKKENDESLANYKKQMAEAKDPETKKMYKQILDGVAQTTASMQTPEYKEAMKKATEMMLQIEAEQYKTDLADYQAKLSEWQLKKDSKVSIKDNLQKFLTETEGVDFTAKLTTNQYGKKVFVNPEYESKSSYWKRTYRAGKPAADVARTFAKQWLSELK